MYTQCIFGLVSSIKPGACSEISSLVWRSGSSNPTGRHWPEAGLVAPYQEGEEMCAGHLSLVRWSQVILLPEAQSTSCCSQEPARSSLVTDLLSQGGSQAKPSCSGLAWLASLKTGKPGPRLLRDLPGGEHLQLCPGVLLPPTPLVSLPGYATVARAAQSRVEEPSMSGPLGLRQVGLKRMVMQFPAQLPGERWGEEKAYTLSDRSWASCQESLTQQVWGGAWKHAF